MIIIFIALIPIACGLVFTGVLWIIFNPNGQRSKVTALVVEVALILLIAILSHFVWALITALLLVCWQLFQAIKAHRKINKNSQKEVTNEN